MKISALQILIIVLIIVIVFVAVLVFAGILPGIRPYGSNEKFRLQVWGTLPETALADSFSELQKNSENITISYSSKSPQTFESELLNALASGTGPDIVIFPSELILKHQDK